jgi:hypothetical protein
MRCIFRCNNVRSKTTREDNRLGACAPSDEHDRTHLWWSGWKLQTRRVVSESGAVSRANDVVDSLV